MARKRKEALEEEAANVGAGFNDIFAGGEKAWHKFEKVLKSAKPVARSMEKEVRRAMKSVGRDLTENIKKQESLNKARINGSKIDQKQYQAVKEQIGVEKTRLRTLERVVDRQNSNTGATKDSTDAIIGQTLKVLDLLSVMGLLKAALGVVTALYNNWTRLQERWTVSTSRMAMATGGTAEQMTNLRGHAEGLRDAFSRLTGEVDGIEVSMGFMEEVATSMRNVSQIGADLPVALLQVSRGFGVGTDAAVQLFRTLQTGVDGGNQDLTTFGANMLRFASDIGANAGQLVSEFIELRGVVAQFGRQGTETFQRAAMMANQFGFEAGRIFQMAQRFDTFQQASEHVNTLNSMMGTSISSFELMMEQDPSNRIEMLRESLRNAGMEWQNMDRFQRMALAQITGQDEDVLARVFGDGASLAEIEQQRAQAENERQNDQRLSMSNNRMMNDLLGRTTEIWNSIDRIIQRITNTLSEALGPIFEEFYTFVMETGEGLADWVRSFVQSEQFRTIVEDIRTVMAQVFDYIRGITWEDVKRGAQEVWNWLKETYVTLKDEIWPTIKDDIWPIIRSVSSAIRRTFDFLSSQEGVLERLFDEETLNKINSVFRTVMRVVQFIGRPINRILEAFGSDRRVVSERDASQMNIQDTAFNSSMAQSLSPSRGFQLLGDLLERGPAALIDRQGESAMRYVAEANRVGGAEYTQRQIERVERTIRERSETRGGERVAVASASSSPVAGRTANVPATASSGTNITVPVVLNVDGRAIAEATIRHTQRSLVEQAQGNRANRG